MDISCGGANYKDTHQMIFGNQVYESNKTNHDNNFEIYNYTYDKSSKFSKEENEAFIIALDIQNKIDSNIIKIQQVKKSIKEAENFTFNASKSSIDKSTNFSLYKKVFEYHKIPLNVYKDEKITEDEFNDIELLLDYKLKRALEVAGMLDDHFAHTAVYRFKCIRQFRNHSVRHPSFRLQALESFAVHFRDYTAVVILVIQHSILLKAIYEFGLMCQSSVIAAMGAFLASAADFSRRSVSVARHSYGY